jgi:murein DD-endopeptidase MepM/ murein hydrolase activator NlpD
MAQKYLFGGLGDTGLSTGVHGHFSVKDLQTNEYKDPASFKHLFSGFRVGQNEIPLIRKNKKGSLEFNPETGLSLTSDYGPRNAPTRGASSYHKGWDLAGPRGTLVKYVSEGGQYIPRANQAGFGNQGVFITPDKRYEIGVAHLQSLGKEANFLGGTPPQTPPSTPDESTADAAANKILAAIFGQKEKEPTTTEQLISTLIERKLKPQKSQDFMASYLASNMNPYMDEEMKSLGFDLG